MKLLLLGSSYMAEEYLKAFKAFPCEVVVVGRDQGKAEVLAARYGAKGLGGGAVAIADGQYDAAIVVSSIDSLKDLTLACLDRGIKNILVEKPGALNVAELLQIKEKLSGQRGVKLGIAYNRRFYNSVRQLKALIELDGGPLGCFFDFTDREKDVLENPKGAAVLKRWGFANASHVIDTAFYLVGRPVEINCRRAGGWDVHPSGNIFAGSGRTEKCLFSYFATWAGGGRWNVEVSTAAGRYKLSPLEELQFCRKNQFAWTQVPLADDDDAKYKPGLRKMIGSVLFNHDFSGLPDIEAQIAFAKTIDGVFGYEN